jgi:hypothetical protein
MAVTDITNAYSLRPIKECTSNFFGELNFFLTLTKFLQKFINILKKKKIYSKNIFYHESNDTNSMA